MKRNKEQGPYPFVIIKYEEKKLIGHLNGISSTINVWSCTTSGVKYTNMNCLKLSSSL